MNFSFRAISTARSSNPPVFRGKIASYIGSGLACRRLEVALKGMKPRLIVHGMHKMISKPDADGRYSLVRGRDRLQSVFTKTI